MGSRTSRSIFGGMYSGSPHKGMDIGMPEGTPVYAAAERQSDRCKMRPDSWGYSWGLLRQNQPHRGRRHAACASIQCGGILWAVCASGDVIGLGSTGNSSGNHLHFELYLENNRVDPYPYIGTDLLSKYLERTF